MDLLQVLTFILAASCPLAAYTLYRQWRRRRQEPSHVSGKEPPGDPALRAALAAARRAAQEEHLAWEAEFCKALGARVPSAGDPYNLTADMIKLDMDLEASGVLFGSDATAYLFARGGHLARARGERQHKDLPDCTCLACNVARHQFYSQGGHTAWN